VRTEVLRRAGRLSKLFKQVIGVRAYSMAVGRDGDGASEAEGVD